MELFNAPDLEHDAWYDYATEWMEIIQRLWTDDEPVSYSGKFLTIQNARLRPRPIQQPHPAIMNAGGSPVGQRWAARHSDMMFTSAPAGDYAAIKQKVAGIRSLAQEYGRNVQVWLTSSVICRPTEREAQEYADYVAIEKGDFDAVARLRGLPNLIEELGQLSPEEARERKRALVLGSFNMQPLIGTPEQIVHRVRAIADAGIDGLNLTFVNYDDELQRWISDVLPLLEEAGLRRPFSSNPGGTIG